MRYKFIKQDGIKDCGVSALYNIIRYYGGNINIEKLRNLTKTGKDGTSIYGIVGAANSLGLISKSYKCELNDLCSIIFPVIAHIKVDKKYSHFIIIKKIIDNEIFIFDPIRGNLKYSLEQFEDEWSNIIITFEKTNELVNEKDNYKTYLFKLIGSNKKMILIISSLSILCTFLSSINSFYLEQLIDNVNKSKNILIIFSIILFFKIILNYIRNKLVINFNTIFDSKLMSNIYHHILSLPIKYHHNRPAGDIVSRVYDLYYIKDFINQLSFTVIVDIILIFTISIFLFIINKLLFLIIIICLLLYTLTYILFRNKINYLILENQKNESKVNSVLVENLVGIDTIKNLNLESKFLDKQNKIYNTFLLINKKTNNIYNVFNSLEEFITSFGLVISLFIGSIFISKNIMTIGSLIAFNSLLINYYSSIKNIFNIDNLIINSKNAYRRINDLFSIDEEKIVDNENTFDKIIEFNNLNFSYNDNNNIKDFSYKIKKSDYLLITGKSGIGKSTIFKLLTKQLECNWGMIKLDNKDINSFSINDIRNNICYVSQNEFIFTDTIENNIKLYNNYSKEDFDKVLNVTMVDKILKNKNIDINYILEEDGHNLSGGERQKIILARALLRKTNFIIFDETMNEIDIDSERNILKRIKTEYNKTIILISHRINNKDLFNKTLEIK